jgi:hypothetical protein
VHIQGCDSAVDLRSATSADGYLCDLSVQQRASQDRRASQHERDPLQPGLTGPEQAPHVGGSCQVARGSCSLDKFRIDGRGVRRHAAMESFFALLKNNVLDRQRWATRAELRLAIVSWIETTYHRRRRQRRLGKLTPIEFETIQPVVLAA